MTPELQSVVDRLELVERQNRGLKVAALAAALLAIVALAAPFLVPKPAREDRARYSVVEANRFLLRDPGGNIAGGMEVEPQGTIKLVLGSSSGNTGAAFLEVHPAGVVDLTLRGPDGRVRAAVLGTPNPSFSLSARGDRSSVALMTRSDGTGLITLSDGEGRTLFRAP
jgi:hypothetical protein